MKTIGFAGTAKNTGKTTAALYLLGLAWEAGFRVALTSIGYDGEAIDNVTGLPKPRYFAQSGMLIATAESCLMSGDAACKILRRTKVDTGLGEVVIAQVERPGKVVLAGPNKRRDLEQVLELLDAMGADLTIADGALNRLMPLLSADGLVLSTGAAFVPDIPQLAEHLVALCALFEFGSWDSSSRLSHPPASFVATRIQLEYDDDRPLELTHGSLIGADTLRQLLDAVDRPVQRLTIPGACLPSLLRELLSQRKSLLNSAKLVLGSPLHLIASAAPLEWQSIFGGETLFRPAYLETLPLLFVTVNPFFPRYRQKSGDYEPAFLDRAELLSACRARISNPPVLDVRQPPLPDLLSLIGPVEKELRHEP